MGGGGETKGSEGKNALLSGTGGADFFLPFTAK